MDVIDKLVQFGLTRQEASLYLVLHTEGDLSGYEAAKLAGISRSNAYAALAALTDKGAVYRLDGTTPRYQALPITDFCNHRLRSLNDTARQLESSLPQRATPAEAYLTIEGAQNISDRLRSMVDAAKERIYMALPPSALTMILPELQAALDRGIKVVVISSSVPNLPEATCYCHPLPEHQIRLIADSQEVITGELGAGGSASCLYSRRKQLVDLFKDALRNEIKLIELEATA